MSPGLGLMLTLGHPCWFSHWGCTRKSKEWWRGLSLVPGPWLLGSSNYCGYITASHVFLQPTEGHPWGINSTFDPSKPPIHPTCVSAPELQPACPEVLALWNAHLPVWSLGLSVIPTPLSSIALRSQPLSPTGPTSCELSRANGLLSAWKQAGPQGNPGPGDLFTPTCLQVSFCGLRKDTSKEGLLTLASSD